MNNRPFPSMRLYRSSQPILFNLVDDARHHRARGDADPHAQVEAVAASDPVRRRKQGTSGTIGALL
jgi:hypothetical protein